jgi:enoyl-CoA hydratase
MEFKNIKLEIDKPIAVLTINRPETLNALNADILSELDVALDDLKQNTEIRCLIFTGAGEGRIQQNRKPAYPGNRRY